MSRPYSRLRPILKRWLPRLKTGNGCFPHSSRNQAGTRLTFWTPWSIRKQDTDRPGSDVVGRAWDDWYGNDTHYEDDLTYSNGSSHYVEVNADNQPKKGGTFPYAEFTFQGTGFDVISVTSGETGRVNVEIRKESEEGELVIVKRYITDTYYGYKYIQDEDGQGGWVEDDDATGENALYQVPILKVENLEYGKYYVKVIPEYYASDAHK